MLSLIRRFTPKFALDLYHRVLAQTAAIYYGHPSRRMTVIGVTGTNGKTTTAYFIAKALEASGEKTGLTSTAIMKIGDKEWLNKTKMTMPGRFYLQRMLKEMADAGCKYAVIETSSQGLVQHRHIGIDYKMAVFTNLTPEHIEAHGGFENYKRAKRLLFESAPIAILNADDPYAEYYATAPGVKRTEWYGIKSDKGLQATDIRLSANGSDFAAGEARVRLGLPGEYNILNALAALAVCQVVGVDLFEAARKLSEVARVPGRFDRVNAGQPWTVIVDYAPEPESFRQLYKALETTPRQRTIHILGSCGGGRDVARRPVLGKLAAEHADIVIVTNEDPYDDDPKRIVDEVAQGAAEAGKIEGQNLFKIMDRREAVFFAMKQAKEGDLIVLTGKGCEPWICVANGNKLPWDEIETARQAIESVLK